MEAIAELAQRIGAIKGFAIGTIDRLHGPVASICVLGRL
jgi:hypothetical protein